MQTKPNSTRYTLAKDTIVLRCIVIRGAAWLVLLSPCNTITLQDVNGVAKGMRTA